ncbi:MAG: GNAT family N-acetyltransferase [Candidatus Thermoplasmatota archaeon]|nr:GNAT family N-acetyltransferase [Candidatus Thermoplasmatota archaeon]
MKIELEPIDSLSQETLAGLFNSIFPETAIHWDIQKEVEKSFEDLEEECSAVAWKGDKPIGAIICVNRNGLQIDHVGVLQNNRRMGIGRMLIRYAIDNADRDIKGLVPKDNQAVMELMEEEGFQRVEEREDCYLYRIEID